MVLAFDTHLAILDELKFKWKKLMPLLLVLTLCASFTAHSSFYRFDRYNTESGLSQNTVNDIVEDKYGFIWFATQDGLNRFDGYQFRVFKHDSNNPNSLSDNWIRSLYVDKQQQLWIGTNGGGLNRYHYQTESFSRYMNSSSKGNSLNRISAITQYNQTELLVGTYGGGILRFDQTQKKFKTIDQTRYFKYINSIAIDNQSQIWFGTSTHGLVKLNLSNNTLTSFTHHPEKTNSLSNNNVLSVYIDDNQQVWAGTEHGLNRYLGDNQGFEHFFRHTSDPSSDNVIRDITDDHKGRLWLASNQGIKRLDLHSKTHSSINYSPTDEHSISANLVHSIYISSDNTLWAGTFSSGVNKYNLNNEQFRHFKHDVSDKTSLSSNIIWNFSEDHQGNIWLATDGGGINYFDRKTEIFHHYLHQANDPQSLSSNFVWAVLAHQPNQVWAGTYDAGLNRLDVTTGKFKRYIYRADDENTIPSNHIIALYQDHQQQIWVGTANGLALFDATNDHFIRFQHDVNNPNSLSHNEVFSIIQTDEHIYWIATAGGGLNRYDKQTNQFYHFYYQVNDPNSIPHNIVAAVTQAPNKLIWITTYGGGIASIDPVTFKVTRYNTDNGLGSNSSLGIVAPTSEDVWVSSNNGISHLKVDSGKITNFTVSDGLQHNEFGSGSYLYTQNQEILFGGVNGFNLFDPKRIIKHTPELTLTLTELRLSNQTVAISQTDRSEKTKQFQLHQPLYLSDKLTFSHLDRLISFEFSTLNHHQVKNVQFAYRLVGFDTDWIETDHRLRLATYTNLPAGDYQLALRAKLPHQQWSEQKQTLLAIEVKAAPWFSLWAYVGYVSFITIIISFIWWQRYKRIKLQRESQERLELALWGSHSELWDWDLINHTMYRSNRFNSIFLQQGKSAFNLSQLDEYAHPDDIEQMMEKIQTHIDNETPYFDATYRRKTKLGDWRWYRSRAKAVSRDQNGKAQRIVGIVEDVNQLIQAQTELKTINDELEYRVDQRTEELSQTLERLKATQIQLIESEKMGSLVELVVGISHELNTPLGVALTAASHVQDNLDELMIKQQKGNFRRSDLLRFNQNAMSGLLLIANNLGKTIDLLHGFKALSPASSNDKKTTFSLSKVLNKLAVVNDSRQEQPKVKLIINCPKNLEVSTYPDDLIEIFLQLLDNSYTHAFTDISEPCVVITVTQQQSAIAIQYTDNGIGLTEQSHKKMFEPFYTSRRGSQCTGLGLPIIYNQVYYRLSGSLSVNSKVGEGFAITISLPIEQNSD